MTRQRRSAITLLALALGACGPSAARGPIAGDAASAARPATEAPPSGREAIESLEFEALRFDPPRPEGFELANGVTVFHLEDHGLPLVSISASLRGGYMHFPRADFGAASAVGALLRTGGTERLGPDEIDALVEDHAFDIAFATGGRRSSASLGTLRRHLHTAIELWTEMLRSPGFDGERVDVWREQQLESVRRRQDDPVGLASDRFSRLLYGDHPAGWSLEPPDLVPDAVTADRLRRVHRSIFCPDDAIIGVTGAVGRAEITELLEAALADWEPCQQRLADPPAPETREGQGVFVIHRELEQSTVVMGHAGGVTQRDGDVYLATQIANWILGGGGFSSRLLATVRGERGLAYSAASFWSAGAERQGIFGAFTQTRPETTVAAARATLDIIDTMRSTPPAADEVQLAVEQTVNGFVFGFEQPSQIVARQVALEAEGLPADWLELYIDGVQRIGPTNVHDVMRRLVDTDRLTILIVGDTTRFEEPASALGPVTALPCC